MSWGWGGNGMKNGDPLILEECETPQTEEDYKRNAEDSIQEIIRLENSDDWEEIPYPDERVSLMGLTLEDSPLKCVRTSATYNTSPENLKAFMSSDDIKQRKQWDTELLELEIIDKIGDISVVFQTYKAPFPVTNRSFVATRCDRVLKDGTIISGGTSINHDKCPYNSSYVRGVATSAIIYKPVPGNLNKCQMTRIVKLDPKGNIPAMAINLGIKKAGDATVKLIELVKKESRHWKKAQPKVEVEVAHSAQPVSLEREGKSEISEDENVMDDRALNLEDSDEEGEFFDTSSYFEVPDHVIDAKLTPLQQRLTFMESNTIHATKKLESVLKKTKRMKQREKSLQTLSFFQLSKWTQVFLLLWPAVLYAMLNAYRKWKRSHK